MADSNYTAARIGLALGPADECALDDSSLAFARRLHDALAHRGHLTIGDKVLFVVKATGRTASTAKGWLAGAKKPSRGKDTAALARALGIRCGWFIFGGRSLNEELIGASIREMSDWDRGKFFRFMFRLHNNDPKSRSVG